MDLYKHTQLRDMTANELEAIVFRIEDPNTRAVIRILINTLLDAGRILNKEQKHGV